MHSAMKTFLIMSAGFVTGTLLGLGIRPDLAETFLRNLVIFEVCAGTLCFFIRNRL